MHHELDFLPAALEIQEKQPSPIGRALVWSIVLFFSIALVWAMVGEIDIVATAQGKIIPSGRVKVIQPVEIGVVRQIAVREGQHVQAGDLLMELDPTASETDLSRLEMELIGAQLDQTRYQQLIQLSTDAGAVPQPGAPADLQVPADLASLVKDSAVQLQQQRMQNQWSEHQARSAALDSTIDSREAELASVEADVKKLQGTLPLITRRAGALKGLLAKKLGSEQAWLELEEKRVEQQQELAVLQSRTRQIAAAVREARQQREALGAAFISELLANLTETERRIDQLHQERVKATRRTRLQRMTAPVDGVVQQLAVHTIGGVVTPAQELMTIVPESEALEVEAWILNKDIGFVEEGQAAEVKIETFPFTRYGTVDAQMLDVSNDAVTDQSKGLVYAGRVLMKSPAIHVGEKRVNLTPGMAVTVEVKTGKRKLIEYILSPLLRYKDESLTER